MDELIRNVVSNQSLPLVTAFILGIIISISPCPLTTNILAIGYINKNISSKSRVFINGLFYTLGMSLSYTLLAVIIVLGADQFRISGWFQEYSEKILAPILIILGLLLMNGIPVRFPVVYKITGTPKNKGIRNYFESLMLGALFALAFCPNSAVLYFGMLIPLTIVNTSNLYLPVVFSLAAGIPVIIAAWLLAFAILKAEKTFDKLKNTGSILKKVVAILFIITGIYYFFTVY